MSQHDQPRHRDVMLDVVSVSDREGRHRDQRCRHGACELAEEPFPKSERGPDGQNATKRGECPACQIDRRRIREKGALKVRQRRKDAREASDQEPEPFPDEEDVEIEGRVKEVMWVEAVL